MTIISGEMGRLPRVSALGGWVRAIISRFGRPTELQGMKRAEFEQIARDLDLSPPELYRLLGRRVVSSDRPEKRFSETEFSSEFVRAPQPLEQEHPPAKVQEFLPIGPFCC